MTKQLKLRPQHLTIKDMLILYLLWFFLQGFYEMTTQLVFEGSLFLTQVVHYFFFIVARLLFVPIALYFILYRYSLPVEEFGLTLKRFWANIKLGFKTSFPLVLLVLFIVHLPLVYTDSKIQPMIVASNPEEIATSLVFFVLLVFMTIIPAFSEELLFRGLTFSFLEERLGSVKALFLNALLYGIFYMHFNIYFITIRIILGFFSTYLFWRCRNIIPSTILQACFHASFILYIFGWGWW